VRGDYNLHGEVASVAGLLDAIREAAPKLLVTHDPATTVPVAGAYDNGAFQRDLSPLVRTRFREGVRETVERFERLLCAGRLDTRGGG
jgi:hypothetical protein